MKFKIIAIVFCITVTLILSLHYFFNFFQRISPIHHLENWHFDPTSKVESRIGNIPAEFLEYLKELDNRDDYSEYTLTPEERQLVIQTIDQLPPLLKCAFQNHLTGIYFINNFIGSGLTDWIIDNDNNFYGYMAYNPVVLQKNLSQLLTWKENTSFIPDSKDFSLHINCGSNDNGFTYILIHEAVHLADYSYHLTPYVEEAVISYIKGPILLYAETHKYWIEYDKPVDDFSDRKNITFYGFNQGPKIPLSSSVKLYRSLLNTPFPSLYATNNWAEDLCELLTFYHLTVKMGRPYQVIIHNKNSSILYEPLANNKVRQRFNCLDLFYTEIDK